MAWLTTGTLSRWIDQRLVDEISVDADNLAEGETADTVVVTRHLAQARGAIEAAISVGGRYSAPLTDSEVGDYLNRIQAHLAIASLYGRRISMPPGVKDLMAGAEAEMVKIKDGASIPGLIDEAAASRSGGIVRGSATDSEIADRDLMADTSPFFNG